MWSCDQSLVTQAFHSKIANSRRYYKKCTKKQERLFKRGYLFIDNENEAENKE